MASCGKRKTDGEDLYRRAEDISASQQCKSIATLEYNESMISDFFNVPQRVTEGVIRCEQTLPKR